LIWINAPTESQHHAARDISTEEPAMSPYECLYLALVIATFSGFGAVLAYFDWQATRAKRLERKGREESSSFLKKRTKRLLPGASHA
jgi:hypothetical protein